jgi:hypothetical protein
MRSWLQIWPLGGYRTKGSQERVVTSEAEIERLAPLEPALGHPYDPADSPGLRVSGPKNRFHRLEKGQPKHHADHLAQRRVNNRRTNKVAIHEGLLSDPAI